MIRSAWVCAQLGLLHFHVLYNNSPSHVLPYAMTRGAFTSWWHTYIWVNSEPEVTSCRISGNNNYDGRTCTVIFLLRVVYRMPLAHYWQGRSKTAFSVITYLLCATNFQQSTCCSEMVQKCPLGCAIRKLLTFSSQVCTPKSGTHCICQCRPYTYTVHATSLVSHMICDAAAPKSWQEEQIGRDMNGDNMECLPCLSLCACISA